MMVIVVDSDFCEYDYRWCLNVFQSCNHNDTSAPSRSETRIFKDLTSGWVAVPMGSPVKWDRWLFPGCASYIFCFLQLGISVIQIFKDLTGALGGSLLDVFNREVIGGWFYSSLLWNVHHSALLIATFVRILQLCISVIKIFKDFTCALSGWPDVFTREVG